MLLFNREDWTLELLRKLQLRKRRVRRQLRTFDASLKAGAAALSSACNKYRTYRNYMLAKRTENHRRNGPSIVRACPCSTGRVNWVSSDLSLSHTIQSILGHTYHMPSTATPRKQGGGGGGRAKLCVSATSASLVGCIISMVLIDKRELESIMAGEGLDGGSA